MSVDINSALQKARKMIKSDAKADAHILRERAADRNNPAYYADQPKDAYSMMGSMSTSVNESVDEYDDSISNAAFEKALDGMSLQNKSTEMPVFEQAMPQKGAGSKLPKEILESLSNNPIDQDVFDPDYKLKKATQLIAESNKRSNQARPQQRIVEQAQPSVSNVDYSLIKTIVEDCMRKYAASITKKILTESVGSGGDALKAIRIGDKFSFITSSGDLYEAELKFKKNVNKK